MLFDIFDNFTPVNIKSKSKLLKKHIFCKAEVILVRGTELLSAFGQLLTAQIQCFYESDDLVLVAILYDTAVFFLAEKYATNFLFIRLPPL